VTAAADNEWVTDLVGRDEIDGAAALQLAGDEILTLIAAADGVIASQRDVAAERGWAPSGETAVGHVLIIEDDDDVRAVERFVLQRSGWVVAEASTGEQGLEMASAAMPDVIICDQGLPGLSGIEVIARLAGDPGTAMIPVVLVTAMSHTSDVISAMRAGAHDYLVKPFDNVELDSRCQAALQVSRQHRRLIDSARALRLLAENVTGLVSGARSTFVFEGRGPARLEKSVSEGLSQQV
jgi:CheY-like chemotaxis protein